MEYNEPKKILVSLVLVLAIARAAHAVDGDGKATTETRPLTPFHGLEAGGAYTIRFAPGEKEQVTITTDSNILPMVKTSVENGVLNVTTEGSISPSNGVTLEISGQNLDQIALSGADTLEATGIKGPKLDVDASGAGSIKLEGQVETLELDLSGAGSFDAAKLTAKTAVIDVAGAGSARVHVTEKLDVDISGVGSVKYSGDPKSVEKEISGVGSLEPVAAE